MKRFKTSTALLFIVLSTLITLNSRAFAQSNGHGPKLQPPMTPKKTKTTKIHDYTVIDDYFWLREKSNPEVIAHLEAENAYTDCRVETNRCLFRKSSTKRW